MVKSFYIASFHISSNYGIAASCNVRRIRMNVQFSFFNSTAIIVIIKTSSTGPSGEIKLFLNCFRNPAKHPTPQFGRVSRTSQGAECLTHRTVWQVETNVAGSREFDSRTVWQVETNVAGSREFDSRTVWQVETNVAGSREFDSRTVWQGETNVAGSREFDSRTVWQGTTNVAGSRL